jgi:hypothetical protein
MRLPVVLRLDAIPRANTMTPSDTRAWCYHGILEVPRFTCQEFTRQSLFCVCGLEQELNAPPEIAPLL